MNTSYLQSFIVKRRVAQIDGSCLVGECAMSFMLHIYKCLIHVLFIYVRHEESCLTHELVMSHTRACHVSHTNLSYLMSRGRMRHVFHASHINESCLTYMDTAFTHKSRGRMRHVFHASHVNDSSPSISRSTRQAQRTDSAPQTTRPLVYAWHDPCICETSPIHIWDFDIHRGDVTHSYLRHDSFIGETWLIHMWDISHSHLRHCHS